MTTVSIQGDRVFTRDEKFKHEFELVQSEPAPAPGLKSVLARSLKERDKGFAFQFDADTGELTAWQDVALAEAAEGGAH